MAEIRRCRIMVVEGMLKRLLASAVKVSRCLNHADGEARTRKDLETYALTLTAKRHRQSERARERERTYLHADARACAQIAPVLSVHIDVFNSENLFWPQIAMMGRGEFFGEVEVFNDIARTSGGCGVCMCVCRVCMYRCAYATLCAHDCVIYIYIYIYSLF